MKHKLSVIDHEITVRKFFNDSLFFFKLRIGRSLFTLRKSAENAVILAEKEQELFSVKYRRLGGERITVNCSKLCQITANCSELRRADQKRIDSFPRTSKSLSIGFDFVPENIASIEHKMTSAAAQQKEDLAKEKKFIEEEREKLAFENLQRRNVS